MKEETFNLTYRIFEETLERLTNNDDHTAERCYITSNEYLTEYMKTFDLKNKKIATVGSSGDQFFNAILLGCKDVTIIDANPYTKLFVEYKMAMIENLNFHVFQNLITSSKMFQSSIYAKISHSLSEESKLFWDTLMLEQISVLNDYVDQFDQNKLARQLTHHERLFNSDFYNDSYEYKKLQKLLQDKDYSLKFLTADLHDFPKVLKEKYDLIMLSNIYAYHRTGENKLKFDKTVSELYNKNLNIGGTIQVQYDFTHNPKTLEPKNLCNKEIRIVKLDENHSSKTVYFLDKNSDDELSI